MTSPGGAGPLEMLTPAAFRAPRHFARSAWSGHVPFAFWLVDVLRPRLLVELGTYHGMSFLAFCQELAESGVEGHAIGVDTWQGDAHAADRQDGVLARLQQEVERHYGRFARLAVQTFDEAAAEAAPGSVDLLHIDGYHTYEAVRHDFETWRDKLAPGAVVLFHDTDMREKDFGVHRFWDEIRRDRPHFAFTHHYGLGVLGWGDRFPHRLQALFEAGPEDAALLRAVFERLGHAVAMEEQVQAFRKDRTARIAMALRDKVRRVAPRLRWPGA